MKTTAQLSGVNSPLSVELALIKLCCWVLIEVANAWICRTPFWIHRRRILFARSRAIDKMGEFFARQMDYLRLLLSEETPGYRDPDTLELAWPLTLPSPRA